LNLRTKEKGALRNASTHMPARLPAAQGNLPAQHKHYINMNKDFVFQPFLTYLIVIKPFQSNKKPTQSESFGLVFLTG
jgi:hypothetical protein